MSAAWAAENPGIGDPTWFRELLDPDVLTIGFARRVPTYKRLTLMLHDPERLRALLTHPERPVQIVIAGKSHPADDGGKRLIQELVEFSQSPDVRERIVFLPDYDIGMAQLLYPGCDVWLNNPLRPFEACGTSGMKAALNGGLNLSILDGWWNEYYDDRQRLGDPVRRQRGRRRRARRPRGGVALRPDRAPDRAAVLRARTRMACRPSGCGDIRHTLATLSPELSADRMVREYVERLYLPAAAPRRALSRVVVPAGARASPPGRRASRRPGRACTSPTSSPAEWTPPRRSATSCTCARSSSSAGLNPDDVAVELVHGRADAGDVLSDVARQRARARDRTIWARRRSSSARSRSTAPGSFGYTVRVVPRHPLLASPAELGLVAYPLALTGRSQSGRR